MTYRRANDPTTQHERVMLAYPDDVARVEALLASLWKHTNTDVLEIVEAGMAHWLTMKFGIEPTELLATTILTDGEIATDLLEVEGLA